MRLLKWINMMISNSYESDAKKFISDLRKIKNAPRYAVGFEHTIKAIEYAVDVVSGRRTVQINYSIPRKFT